MLNCGGTVEYIQRRFGSWCSHPWCVMQAGGAAFCQWELIKGSEVGIIFAEVVQDFFLRNSKWEPGLEGGSANVQGPARNSRL